MASVFYDKDGKAIRCADDVCPEGLFDTPLGRNTDDTEKTAKKAKPKAAPKKAKEK